MNQNIQENIRKLTANPTKREHQIQQLQTLLIRITTEKHLDDWMIETANKMLEPSPSLSYTNLPDWTEQALHTLSQASGNIK